jgi:amino acid transporter
VIEHVICQCDRRSRRQVSLHMRDDSVEDDCDTTQLLADTGDDHLDLTTSDGSASGSSAARLQLRREVTQLDATAITVGSIIGSGIFSSPGVALAASGSVGFSLLAWLIGGVMASMSSLVYCELGAMLPAAGGDYVYLTKAFGPRMAFTWAFCQFFVYKPTSLAVSGQIMGRYTAAVLLSRSDDRTAQGESSWEEKMLAVLFVLCLTGFNVLPIGTVVRISTGVQVVCKPALCIGIVCMAIASTVHDPSVIQGNLHGAFDSVQYDGMGPAIFASLFAYNGWQNCGQMAEEMRNPQQALPRAIITASTLLYAE